MRYTIGLTGQIASGKSTVSAYLQQKGATIIDADLLAREVVLPGKPAHNAIKAYFGIEYFYADGTLDRKKLGARVFSDPEALQQLNEITHPRVIEETLVQMKEKEGIFVIDAPLLLQAGMDVLCDEVWIVRAAKSVRLQRIMQRDGLDNRQAEARIRSQEKKEQACVPVYFIENNKDKEALEEAVAGLWEEMQKRCQTKQK